MSVLVVSAISTAALALVHYLVGLYKETNRAWSYFAHFLKPRRPSSMDGFSATPFGNRGNSPVTAVSDEEEVAATGEKLR